MPEGFAINLETLREMAGRGRSEGGSQRAPAMAVEMLKEHFDRYQAFLEDAPPFSAGDLVTPRKDSTLKGAGDPHIVLEATTDYFEPLFEGEPHTHGFGSRYDIRVGAYYGHHFVTFWQESFDFEPWVDPKA